MEPPSPHPTGKPRVRNLRSGTATGKSTTTRMRSVIPRLIMTGLVTEKERPMEIAMATGMATGKDLY